MKMPEELSYLPDDPMRGYEDVVRRCADVAYKFDWNRHMNPKGSLRRAILADFGLEPEK